MHALATLALFLLSSLATADISVNAGIFGSSQQVIATDAISVPGDNPLVYCEDPSIANHILKIDKVDLDPSPPEAGKTLSIKATGNFTEQVEEGAYALLTVKFGSIRLIHRREDLCAQMKNIDKECPLEKGSTTITRDIELPSKVPPGTFNVEGDVYTKDDRKITCLQATVSFGKR